MKKKDLEWLHLTPSVQVRDAFPNKWFTGSLAPMMLYFSKNQPGFNYFCAQVAGEQSCRVIVNASALYSSVLNLAIADGIYPQSDVHIYKNNKNA